MRTREVGPFEKALKQHIEDHGITRLSVSWGPDADKISREERAKELLESLQRSAAFRALPEKDSMLADMKIAYEALGRITKMCQTNIKDWAASGYEEDFGMLTVKQKGDIFCEAEQASLHLGNWIRNSK